jgi:ABC-type multidrug transport system fused ATPase/permease subunit
MSALFYFGGLIMKNSVDPVTGIPSITPTAFFMAVLVIQGGATQAGFALAAGADLGKALNAVSKVFGIIEYPSRINAFEMDEKKIGQSSERVIGKIELKDVWFRYPSRK